MTTQQGLAGSARPRTATRNRTAWAAASSALLASALVAWTLGAHGSGEDGLTLAARYTARWAFVPFALAYSASALRTLWPGPLSTTMLRQRRALGVFYGVAQMIHLGTVVAFFAGTEHELTAGATSLGGGLGFLVAGAMTLTSNDAAVRRLGGRAWKRLHRTGIHYLWAIYAFTYLGRVGEDPSYLPGLLTVAVILGLRVEAARRVRSQGS